jgi:hypothetical protein
VTISTVGYGDYYPVTNPGRFAGAVIIVVGVGIFGTFTGYLANLFLGPRKEEAGEEAGEQPAGTDSAGERSTAAAPVDGVRPVAATPEAQPPGTGTTLEEIRSLLTSSEANLESIRLLLDEPDRPAH